MSDAIHGERKNVDGVEVSDTCLLQLVEACDDTLVWLGARQGLDARLEGFEPAEHGIADVAVERPGEGVGSHEVVVGALLEFLQPDLERLGALGVGLVASCGRRKRSDLLAQPVECLRETLDASVDRRAIVRPERGRNGIHVRRGPLEEFVEPLDPREGIVNAVIAVAVVAELLGQGVDASAELCGGVRRTVELALHTIKARSELGRVRRLSHDLADGRSEFGEGVCLLLEFRAEVVAYRLRLDAVDSLRDLDERVRSLFEAVHGASELVELRGAP